MKDYSGGQSPISAAALILLTAALATATPVGCLGQEAQPGVRREGEDQAAKALVPKDLLGDPLPPGAVARFGTIRLRHWGTVTFVAFLPDNKTLISAGNDGRIRTWDITTGKELAPFEVRESSRGSYALSADGMTLLAAYTDGLPKKEEGFRRWDVATRKPIGDLLLREIQGSICPAVVSPNGRLLATGHNGKVRLWDTRSLRLDRELAYLGGVCEGLSFSPDGKRLVTCGNAPGVSKVATVAMWEVATGDKLWATEGTQLVRSVVFLPDGKTVAAGGNAKGSTTLYDAATGEEKGVLRAGGSRLAASPDSKMLAIACVPTAEEWPGAVDGPNDGACDGACAVCLWDLAANKAARTLVGNQHAIYAMAFSPDGKTLAAGCRDGTLALWDVGSGRRLHVSGHEFAVLGLAFAPDGKTVASRGDDRALRLWDPTSGKQKERLEVVGQLRESAGWDGDSYYRQSIAYSPDGKRLACLYGLGEVVRVWDTATGQIQSDLKVPKAVKVPVSRARCLAFAPDGKTLACGDEEGVLHVFDLATGEPVHRLDFQQGAVRASDKLPSVQLAFSPDGKTLAGAYFNEVIRLWDVPTGALLPNKLTSFAFGFHFWDDGRVLIAGDVNRDEGPVISLLDVKTGTALRTLRGHEIGGWKCMGLAVSPDGQLLASGSQDRTVRVWELTTGEEVVCFKGHERPVLTVAFSPDGKYVVSGSRDTTALVWDLYPSRAPGAAGPVGPLTAEQSKELWADLADKDARRAFHASVVLTQHPAEALSLLEGRLRPAPPVNLDKVLKNLDAEDFKVRQAASAALREFGRPARPALERALAAGPPAEARRRLEAVLEDIGSASRDGEVLRRRRALRVLEVIGSEPAQRLLEALSKGEDLAEQTLDARAALERIKKRSPGR
jgi:WD40 repeat protein